MAGPLSQRFLIPDEFGHCAPYLEAWNICSVASNLYRIQPSAAMKYLDMNVTVNNINVVQDVVRHVQASRASMFDCIGDVQRHLLATLNLFGGADVYQQHYEQRISKPTGE